MTEDSAWTRGWSWASNKTTMSCSPSIIVRSKRLTATGKILGWAVRIDVVKIGRFCWPYWPPKRRAGLLKSEVTWLSRSDGMAILRLRAISDKVRMQLSTLWRWEALSQGHWESRKAISISNWTKTGCRVWTAELWSKNGLRKKVVTTLTALVVT
jgi:hypothetical protein